MVELLATNRGQKLVDALTPRLRGSTRLDVSSAFFSEHGAMQRFLDSPAARARVIVRLDYPTNPKALQVLMADERVDLRGFSLEVDPTFHEKLVLATGADDRRFGAYVGSANWTHRGLHQNTEAGVWIEEPELLAQIARHFEESFQRAAPVTDRDIEILEHRFRWYEAVASPPDKDPGTMRVLWPSLSAGAWLLKQNGISADPFLEGEHSFPDYNRNQCAQTLNGLPKAISPGQPVILCYIARRKGTRAADRLVYGRGLVADADPALWHLPPLYLNRLRQSGVSEDDVAFLERWPDVVWLGSLECIDYPRNCSEYVWLSDHTDFAHFRRGHQYLSKADEQNLNKALDRAAHRFGIAPLDREGIWWNTYLEIDPTDPLYMTRSRMAQMMTGE